MSNDAPPLVVDLDGTLTPTDTLAEALIRVCRVAPARVPSLLLTLVTKGKAQFKRAVTETAGFSPETLPYRQPLIDYLREQRVLGRRLVLATASHRTVAEPIAAHLGLFDEILTTENDINLKGVNKLTAIKACVGERFAYAGDSSVDMPIWRASAAAILVGTSTAVAESVRKSTSVELELNDPPVSLGTWVQALRIHQWLKNLLVFVPLLTAFSFLDPPALFSCITAFFAFSMTASGTYIVNDLLDLDSDRQHPRKRYRPLASGVISVERALGVSSVALLAGFSLAALVSMPFLIMLGTYLVITSSYSLVLKRYVIVDVIVLSLLYTLRILAGAVAIDVSVSTWLMAFSVFIFFSLALVKRCSELVSLGAAGRVAVEGRDYRAADLAVLWPLGVSSSISAVVVYGLFINAPQTQARYAAPLVLWLVAPALIYWLSRLWIKTTRGEMHDDPVVYAVTDRGSRLLVIAIALIVICAHFIKLDFKAFMS